MPMPWGQALDHPVRPLELLGFPLAFTQNDLLSPDDFVKRAGEGGQDRLAGTGRGTALRRASAQVTQVFGTDSVKPDTNVQNLDSGAGGGPRVVLGPPPARGVISYTWRR